MQLRIFTTGGTIDKLYFDAASEFVVGEPMIGGILDDANVTFDFTITELFRKDSLDITSEDRATIRNAVAADSARYVLITHGTDSMAETARALQGIPNKTIILTGAMSPRRFQKSDAVFNVGCAVGAMEALPPGVYVAMNGRVFPAESVRKNREKGRFE